jgi:MauM/NapG family ferredoxin protein
VPQDRDSADRRRFLQRGFARLAGPLAEYLDQRLDLPAVRTRLRPPGAIPEDELLATCYRCGGCVEVCPAGAISRWATSDERLVDTPVIDADLAACLVCDGLLCTQACPSGALQPLHQPGEIAMGLAEVDQAKCRRSTGDNCTACVERCPLGSEAITVEAGGPPTVLAAGCVGCGVCQLFCPTRPKAIRVEPA